MHYLFLNSIRSFMYLYFQITGIYLFSTLLCETSENICKSTIEDKILMYTKVKSYFSSSVKCILIAKLTENLHFDTCCNWFFYLAARITKTNFRSWFEENFWMSFFVAYSLDRKKVNVLNTVNTVELNTVLAPL